MTNVPEWILLAAVIFVCFLVVLRSVEKEGIRPYRLDGLLWLADGKSYWGPCCEDCLVQFLLRPAFQSSQVQYYELVCPICHQPFSGSTFTLQALLNLERQLAARLKKKRIGPSLPASRCSPSRTQLTLTQ